MSWWGNFKARCDQRHREKVMAKVADRRPFTESDLAKYTFVTDWSCQECGETMRYMDSIPDPSVLRVGCPGCGSTGTAIYISPTKKRRLERKVIELEARVKELERPVEVEIRP